MVGSGIIYVIKKPSHEGFFVSAKPSKDLKPENHVLLTQSRKVAKKIGFLNLPITSHLSRLTRFCYATHLSSERVLIISTVSWS